MQSCPKRSTITTNHDQIVNEYEDVPICIVIEKEGYNKDAKKKKKRAPRNSDKPIPTLTCTMCMKDQNTACDYPKRGEKLTNKKLCKVHGGLRQFYYYCDFEKCMEPALVGRYCYRHRGGKYNEKVKMRPPTATHRETVDHGRVRYRKVVLCKFQGCYRLGNQKGGWCKIHPDGKEIYKQNKFCSGKKDDTDECIFYGREKYCRVHGGHRVCIIENCNGNGYFKGKCLLHCGPKPKRKTTKRKQKNDVDNEGESSSKKAKGDSGTTEEKVDSPKSMKI